MELLPDIGGRIHAIRVGGADLLRTPDDVNSHVAEPLLWGSYPMVPWCNRIPFGELWFEGAAHRQPLNLDTFAVHGRALAAPWRAIGSEVLEFLDAGDAGFPWPYRARQEFVVDGATMSLELSLENTGVTRMPAGLGIHPWFAAPNGLDVALPADLVYPSSGESPVGPPIAVAGDRDLRSSGNPRNGIDECWTGLTEQQIRLDRPDGIQVTFSFTATADHVVLAAIGDLGGVAIEPQTHAVDGHGRRERSEPGGIAVLEPGDSLGVTYRIAVS